MSAAAPMPHGPLEVLVPGIHWLQGTVRMGPGVVINRVMVVLENEGELTIISSVRLDDAGITALEALGKVRHLVKIGTHGMDDAWYADRYDVLTWAAPGVQVAGRPADRELVPGGDTPVPWLSTFAFSATKDPELVFLAERGDGLLITCDCLQSWTSVDRCSFMGRMLTPVMGFTAGPVVVGPPWRKGMTPKGGSLQGDFERLGALSFDSLVGGHGRPLLGGARGAVHDAIRRVWPDAALS